VKFNPNGPGYKKFLAMRAKLIKGMTMGHKEEKEHVDIEEILKQNAEYRAQSRMEHGKEGLQ
jgi:hypothetical protein